MTIIARETQHDKSIGHYAGISASKAESTVSLRMQEHKDAEKAQWLLDNADRNRAAGLAEDTLVWA